MRESTPHSRFRKTPRQRFPASNVRTPLSCASRLSYTRSTRARRAFSLCIARKISQSLSPCTSPKFSTARCSRSWLYISSSARTLPRRSPSHRHQSSSHRPTFPRKHCTRSRSCHRAIESPSTLIRPRIFPVTLGARNRSVR